MQDARCEIPRPPGVKSVEGVEGVDPLPSPNEDRRTRNEDRGTKNLTLGRDTIFNHLKKIRTDDADETSAQGGFERADPHLCPSV